MYDRLTGFCDRAGLALGRLLPPPTAGDDVTAIGALQGAGAGAQFSSEATVGAKKVWAKPILVPIAPTAEGLDGLFWRLTEELAKLCDGKLTHYAVDQFGN